MANYLRHVNGPALIYYGPQGLTGSLTLLGETEDAVRMRFQETESDVHTDASGEGPADVQKWARICFISFRLVVWDDVVLGDYLSLKTGGRTWGHGAVAPPGLLLAQQGAMNQLYIANPYGSLPFRFPFTHPTQSQEIPVGTKVSHWDLTVRAIAGIGSNTDPAGLVSQGSNSLYLYINA